MANKLLWLFILLTMAFGGPTLACRKSGPQNKAQAGGGASPGAPNGSGAAGGQARREYAMPVGVLELARRAINEYINTHGSVAPARSLPVRAEESGRIHFIKAWREGDLVKQGELLARLDEEETSRSLEIAGADLDTARNQLELALKRVERTTIDYERAQAMFEHGQISRKIYEEREFQMNSARLDYERGIINVQRAEKQLERERFRAERKIVLAPMTGYLVTRSAVENRPNPTAADSAETIDDQEGRLVGTNQILAGVVDMKEVLIRCNVTAKDIGKIRSGQSVEAFVYAERDLPVQGRVADVAPIMDMQKGAFMVDVLVDNPKGRLRPGMFARVNIIIRTRRDALVVDRKVLQRRNNEDIVFVVGGEERAERRVVRLGLENPEEVEIVDGLRSGEKLITLGFETLQDKVKVKVVETEPAVAAEDRPSTATSAAQPEDKARG